MDVLVIYQWCTFGGVERALLNRAKAFQQGKRKVTLSVGFLQEFQGALPSFQAYIRSHGLEDRLTAFRISEDSFPDPNGYDIVLNIDTPQAFGRIAETDNQFVECHTPYAENRRYLQHLPPFIRGLLVPSESFKALVLSECPRLPPVSVLPNPVPEEFFQIPRKKTRRIFAKTPLIYMARLDELKNIREAARIFEALSGDERIMFVIVGRGVAEENMQADLRHHGIVGKSFLRDRIHFDSVPAFIRLMRDHRGIFLSPSKGESFGLSAAEFITAGVPVLLSDIPPHRELVENDERHLYTLGDLPSAEEKIAWITAHWEAAGKHMIRYGRKFKDAAFLKAWRAFIASMS